jgi:hypothetical protein
VEPMGRLGHRGTREALREQVALHPPRDVSDGGVEDRTACLTVMPCIPLRGIICARVYPFTNP